MCNYNFFLLVTLRALEMSFTTKQIIYMIIEEDWNLGAEVICDGSDDDFDLEYEDDDADDSDGKINERYEI